MRALAAALVLFGSGAASASPWQLHQPERLRLAAVPGASGRITQAGMGTTDLDTCAEFAALGTIETGTCGTLVFSDSPTFVDDFNLAAAGVKFAGASGVLTLTGLSGQAEDLSLDLAGTANVGVLTSSTGLTLLSFGSINLAVGADPADGTSGVNLPNAGCIYFESSPAGTDDKICNNASEQIVITSGGNQVSGPTYSSSNSVVVAAGGTFGLEGVGGDSYYTKNGTKSEIQDDGTVALTLDSGITAFGTHPTVTVDAATTFAATSTYMILQCTGPETINTITGGTTAGALLIIENTDTECTIADDDAPTASNAVNLTGSASDVGAAEKVITLIYDGSAWFQTAESDN